MKKIILSLVAIVATINAMAISYQSYANMQLKSSDNQTCDVCIAQAATLKDGYNKGYCSIINMENRKVAMYAIFGGADYQTFQTKTLGELPFGIITNSATSYTISFSKVSGTETLTLYDAVEDKYTDIVEGGSYAFTAAANQTIADRFMLKKKPAEPAICHQYGNLIITGHQGAKVKVLDMADQVAIAEQTLATDDEVISLSELTSGEMYQVVMDGETMLIRIQ